MSTLQDYAVEVEEYVPTSEDLAEYASWSAGLESRSWWDRQIEARDRREALESIRREAWNRAEFAVIAIEGIAAGLSAGGLDGTARTLLAACGNINDVLRQYA